MSLKKNKKKKKDALEGLVESTQKILDDVYILLDEAIADYKKVNDLDKTMVTAKVLDEMAKELGKTHIDFMGMS